MTTFGNPFAIVSKLAGYGTTTAECPGFPRPACIFTTPAEIREGDSLVGADVFIILRAGCPETLPVCLCNRSRGAACALPPLLTSSIECAHLDLASLTPRLAFPRVLVPTPCAGGQWLRRWTAEPGHAKVGELTRADGSIQHNLLESVTLNLLEPSCTSLEAARPST
jgi:hypothetical protein